MAQKLERVFQRRQEERRRWESEQERIEDLESALATKKRKKGQSWRREDEKLLGELLEALPAELRRIGYRILTRCEVLEALEAGHSSHEIMVFKQVLYGFEHRRLWSWRTGEDIEWDLIPFKQAWRPWFTMEIEAKKESAIVSVTIASCSEKK